MAANSAYRIVELDPDTIKNNLKTFLRSQSEFTDFDFEGAGMNILLELLAYNTHYMAMYMNMLGAESFMDSAQLRKSIVSHAKHVGYVPRGQSPARTYATITVTPGAGEDNDATTLLLPRWTKFYGQAIEGVNYPFVTINANTAIKTDGKFTFSNVLIKQGQPVSRVFNVTSNNPKREFFIPSANVDIDEILVSVQESASNTEIKTYTKFNDLTALRANSQVFFLEENTVANNNYKIYFGDGYLGKRPSDGQIVTVTYLVSDGKHANGCNSFILTGDINGYDDNVSITTTSAAYGGSDQESIEQIRYRAPRYYTTQGRAVTATDYETLITMDYPNVQSVSVWGGEEESPPTYGKVYIALKPKDNYYITNLEKDQIINQIVAQRSILSVIPEIKEPDYTWLLLNVKVYYDMSRTNLDTNTLKQMVRNAIINYSDENLQKFDSKFRVSQLQQAIEAIDDSINSATVKLQLQKRLTPTYAAAKNYTIDFKSTLEKDTFDTFPSFTVYDTTGIARQCFLEEVPAAWTGIDSINVLTGGNDYEDATVTITGDGQGATATATLLNGKIQSITLTNRGTDYTQATVTITSNTGYGAAAIADLQYNNGEIRTFYYKTNGEKVFLYNLQGTINYKTGIVEIENINIRSVTNTDLYNDDVITFNAEPTEYDINAIRNAILDIDKNDNKSIQITMVAE